MVDIPIFLVSMKGDHARRERMSTAFPALYPEMRLVNAVDGRLLSAQDYFRYASSAFVNHGRLLAPAEVGCSLSHIEALEQFLRSGAERAIILEDDVLGDDSGLSKALEDVRLIPNEAVIILGGQEGMPSRKYIFGKPIVENRIFALPYYSTHHIFRTCCYGVTLSSAASIVASQKMSLKLADAWWAFSGKAGGLTIHYSHQLAHPVDRSDSHIENSRSDLSSQGKRGFVSFLVKRYQRLKRRLGAVLCRLRGYQRVVR
jgi:glycosyl transferase, family 25